MLLAEIGRGWAMHREGQVDKIFEASPRQRVNDGKVGGQPMVRGVDSGGRWRSTRDKSKAPKRRCQLASTFGRFRLVFELPSSPLRHLSLPPAPRQPPDAFKVPFCSSTQTNTLPGLQQHNTLPLLVRPACSTRHPSPKLCVRSATHLFACADLSPLSKTVDPAPSPSLGYALHCTCLHLQCEFFAGQPAPQEVNGGERGSVF